MDKAIKIENNLVSRIDRQREKFSLDTRQNLTNTIVRKGLDFLENFGYEKLLEIPNGESNATRELDSTRQESSQKTT